MHSITCRPIRKPPATDLSGMADTAGDRRPIISVIVIVIVIVLVMVIVIVIVSIMRRAHLTPRTL